MVLSLFIFPSLLFSCLLSLALKKKNYHSPLNKGLANSRDAVRKTKGKPDASCGNENKELIKKINGMLSTGAQLKEIPMSKVGII